MCEPRAVIAVEVGISDHKLIHWTTSVTPQIEHYKTIHRRNVKDFKLENFVERLERSSLYASVDPNSTALEIALRYQSVISEILD